MLPGHDFVGDTYWVDYFARELGAGRFPHWTAMEGLGRPTTIQRGSILLFLPVVALKSVVSDTVVAAKLWYALLHTLSFATFFGLARRYGASREGALLGAFAYLLAPLHIDEFARGGHWQLAVSFFLAPWILSSMIALVRDPRASIAARVALLLAWSVLSDNERTVTLLPVYAAACAFELYAQGRAGTSRRIGALGGAAMLGAAITAWLTIPLLAERSTLNLLRATDAFALFPDRLRELRGPLFTLDQGGFFGLHPIAHAFGVHAGWLLVGLGAFAALRALVRREHAALLGAIALVSIWIATWDRAWCDSGIARVAFALVVVAVAWLGTRKRTWTSRAAFAGVAFFGVIAFVPSAALLGHVPPFATLGNKLWFLTVALSLVLSILVATIVTKSQAWEPRRRALFALAAVALAALDVLTSTTTQTSLPNDLDAHLTRALAPLASSATPSRYIPYPYVEADAVDAFALRFASKPCASSWLLWAGGRWGAERIAIAYADLDRLENHDDDATAYVLDQLAAINVRYLVVPGDRAGRLTRASLLSRVGDADPAILENMRWTGDASVTLDGTPVAYRRPSDERFEIAPTMRGTHVVAEAWYPYWSYAIGGVVRSTRPTRDGLIAIDVDADGPVVVTYEPPSFHRALRWLSGAALLLAIALVIRSKRDQAATATRGA